MHVDTATPLFIHPTTIATMHSLLFPSKRDAAPGGRRTLWLWAGSSALAFLLMVSSFFLYVDAERTLEKTAEQRLNAVLAAEKMRHTTEGLTRMARNYILSGKPEFKRWYFELDDIRLGKTKEPTNQYMWDLRVYGEIHNMEVLANPMPLHTYFESVAKEDDQGNFLREAWAHTNALSTLEKAAIKMYDIPEGDTDYHKARAKQILFGDNYNEAKLDVMRPLMSFRGVSTERNMQATKRAKRWADVTRTSFLLLGLVSILLAWKTYQSMRSIHGASVKELQEQIERLGKGDFAAGAMPTSAVPVDPNSLMSWLNQSRVRLQEIDAARQTAEYELSDKNRDLAINNLVLQELTTGLPLPELLDRFILTIESNHPGLIGSVLLADADGTTLRHAAAPSLGDRWAQATAQVSIGAGAGSCGTAACRKERVLVEDVLVHPFWTEFRAAALDAGVRSSWSQPIFDNANNVIGTFALYQKIPALPTEQELRWLDSFTTLAGYLIERSRLADALNETRYLYDLIAKNINDIIWVQELPSLRLRFLSPSSQKMLGWTHEDFYANKEVALPPAVRKDMGERFLAMHAKVRQGDLAAAEQVFESELINKETGLVPVEFSVKITLDEHGEPTTLIGVARDITERKKTENLVRKMAFYDALTGMPNRRLLEDRLRQTISTAKRQQARFSVLFIDLDRFKAVNDTHGHQTGDWLLIQVALRMQAVLRESDTAARVGGDEFVVLLPDATTMEAALKVGHKIRSELDKVFVTPQGAVLDISCSVGIAMYPEHADNPRDLLHFGDEAMYHAKKDGRNAVVGFDIQRMGGDGRAFPQQQMF